MAAYRAVAPLVVGHRADGGMSYFHEGQPVVGLPDAEVERLVGKGAVEVFEPVVVEAASAAPKRAAK